MCATSFPSLDIHAIASEPVAVNISLEAPPLGPRNWLDGVFTRYRLRSISDSLLE